MADLKISQLPAATALDGTEVGPFVQSGTTKKATIDQILTPAAGKGINFSANGGDLLTLYDEGTWNPTVTAGTGTITTYTVNTASYTRIGRQVTLNFRITVSAIGTASGAMIVTLPITSASNSAAIGRETATTGYIIMGHIFNAGTTVPLYDGRTANGNCFGGGNGSAFNVSVTYFV
jgi:hypothetical protein